MNTKKFLIRVACVLGAGVLAIAGALYPWLPNSTRAEAEQYAVYSAYLEEGVNEDSPSPVDRRDSAVIISTTIPVNAEEVRGLSTTERWRDFVQVSSLFAGGCRSAQTGIEVESIPGQFVAAPA